MPFPKQETNRHKKNILKYEPDSTESGKYIFNVSLAAIIFEVLYGFVKLAGTV